MKALIVLLFILLSLLFYLRRMKRWARTGEDPLGRKIALVMNALIAVVYSVFFLQMQSAHTIRPCDDLVCFEADLPLQLLAMTACFHGFLLLVIVEAGLLAGKNNNESTHKYPQS